MTETHASGPAPDSPHLSHRLDASDAPWPQRPWIMAALCALGGLLFHMFVDRKYVAEPAPLLDAAAAFIAVATLVFVLGVERRRWHWAAGFALLWGAVMGLITWHAAGYNIGGSPVEWPFWSGMLAVLVATPLFQTRRDVAADWRFWKLWQMPYERLHSHAWTDAVLGAAGLAFTGVTFLLVLLIGEMFNVIGITLIRDLFNGEWFPWMLAGAAFGGAVGLLRERDRLVATLQRLVMIVLAVLAPVLAVALLLFLLSLLGTGLQKLWDSGFSTAVLMMAAAAFAVLLLNAAIGNGREERSANRLLQGAAAALAVAVLPLAAIAFYAMHLRVIQYGWTPERIWGVIAAIIALAYGVAGLWAVVKGRRDFDDLLRPLQQRLAIGLVLLALFLALPIVDFGEISTRDQLARLKSGTTKLETFDWAAMAFDFGPSGRKALGDLGKSPDKARAGLAAWALKAKNRWDLSTDAFLTPRSAMFAAKPVEERIGVFPKGHVLPAGLYAVLDQRAPCRASGCAAYMLSDDRVALIWPGNNVSFLARDEKGQWTEDYEAVRRVSQASGLTDNLEKATVEVRPVTRKQMFVNGKPVGDSFE
jgi:hypothetical protein